VVFEEDIRYLNAESGTANSFCESSVPISIFEASSNNCFSPTLGSSHLQNNNAFKRRAFIAPVVIRNLALETVRIATLEKAFHSIQTCLQSRNSKVSNPKLQRHLGDSGPVRFAAVLFRGTRRISHTLLRAIDQ